MKITVSITSANLNDQLSAKISGAIQDSITTTLAIVKDRWQTEVQQKLNSSRPLYLMGLDFNSVVYPYGNNAFCGAVELHGKLPNMLETGFSSFDMKVGFSKSSKAIQKKGGGWYLTIPLRHSTPGSFMYGSPMSKSIYSQAKKLGNREHLSFPGAGNTSWTGYRHKNKIHDGLTRIIKNYNNTSQSQYITWRRVSDKSDPKSWMHPGYAGIKVAEKLGPFANDTFSKLLEYNIKQI